jgi:predicted ATPase
MPDLPSGTVTFLFTDIEGSTKLLHELGEAYADALAEHRRLLREVFALYRGVEVDSQGDAFFCAFARATDAIAAATEAQHALAEGPIRVRMGLHTGEPQLSEDGYVGIEVHQAARIAAAGHGGQLLVSQTTQQLLGTDVELRDLGEHRLKDLFQPVRLYQLGGDEFPPLRSLHQTNLPIAATPLVGRSRELADVLDLLRANRLLTLTGPGGVGKTRLALQAAAEVIDDFRDGVWLVELAALRDPDLVLQSVAQTLGVKEPQTMGWYLREKQLLLVLDNFEQLLEAAPSLARLLREAPRVRLLVTSRALLHLSGEHEFLVPTLADEAALRLFGERARAVRPLFAQDEHLPEICQRLDNLPLAIELAAARANVLTTKELLRRLEPRLPLLTRGARDRPKRQRTLRATIDWSYDLLTPEEQSLFARLAAFTGGFSLEAAETVARASVDTLQSLVEKSLLWERGERFSMLETIHEYALERLVACGEHEHVARRHAEFYLALAERLHEPWSRSRLEREESAWMDQADSDHDNLRTSLAWFIENKDADAALRLFTPLAVFWDLRAHVPEGRRWAERTLSLDGQASPRLRAKALGSAGLLAFHGNDLAAAAELFEQGLALSRRLGDKWSVAQSLMGSTTVAIAQQNFAQAKSQCAESHAIFRELEYRPGLQWTLHLLGYIERELGHHSEARRLMEESITLATDTHLRVMTIHGLGDLSLEANNFDEAEKAYRDALTSAQELKSSRDIAYCLAGLACVAAGLGDPARAGRLWGAAESVEESAGVRMMAFERGRYERRLDELDGPTLASAVQAGRSMSVGEAVAYALEYRRPLVEVAAAGSAERR